MTVPAKNPKEKERGKGTGSGSCRPDLPPTRRNFLERKIADVPSQKTNVFRPPTLGGRKHQFSAGKIRTGRPKVLRGCFKVWSPLTTSAADSAGVAQQFLRYLLGALDGASRKGTRLVGRRRSRRVLFGGPRGSNSPFATSTWCHVSPTRAPLLIPLSLYDYYGAQRPWV